MPGQYGTESRLINFFLEVDVLQKIDLIAHDNGRTRSSQLRIILRDFLVNEKRKKMAPKSRGIFDHLGDD